MKVIVKKMVSIGGKVYKPSNKPIDIDTKDAKLLIAIGDVVDAEPKEEKLELTLQVDEQLAGQLEELTKENKDLKAELETCKEEAQKEIESLNKQLEELTKEQPNEAKSTKKGK